MTNEYEFFVMCILSICHLFEVINLSSSDDQLFYISFMFSYGFQKFIIIYVNVKFNLN